MHKRSARHQHPIELFLDSSFLRGINPRSAFIEPLRDHALAGRVRIHIPWVVLQEVTTGIAEEVLSKDLKPFDRAIQWTSMNAKSAVLHDQWAVVRKNLENLVTEGFGAWIDSLHAVVDEPSEGDSKRIFDRYFSGAPPFSKRKSRNDIPDAYIFDIVQRACGNAVGHVHFIVKDGPLRDHCKAVENLLTHDTVESFLQHLPLQIAADEKFPEQLRDLLESPKHVDEVLSRIGGGLLDELTFSNIRSNLFPNARHRAVFAWPGPITGLRMHFEKVMRLSRDIAVLPLTCRMSNVGVYVQVSPEEYQNIQGNSRFSFSPGDTNEANGVVVTTGVLLEIQATLGIHFGKEPDDDSEIPGITVEEMNRVRVLDFSLPAEFGKESGGGGSHDAAP